MNREKLEAKLRNYEERLKDVAKAIKETREQLDEKLKLRHGDFGLNWDGHGRIMIINQGNDKKRAANSTGLFENLGEEWKLKDSTIFGNIFDLMNDWGKDLTEFKTGCTTDDKLKFYLIAELEGSKGSDYRIGTQTNTIIISAKQVEKYWRKLGRLIITQKRKENKCS